MEHATTYIPYTLIEQLEAKKNKEVKQMLKLPSNIKSEVLVLENQKTKKTKELRWLKENKTIMSLG